MRVIFIVLLQHALCVEPHEVDAVICFGISWRWAGDEHHAFGGDSVLADPARRPFAPVVRLLREIYGIHPVGEREILAYSRVGARRDDPGMAISHSESRDDSCRC